MKSREQLRNALSFEVGLEESDIIEEIAARAVRLARRHRVKYDKLTAIMDVTACHANGTPLLLRSLLAADDGNFGHDVFGIRRHIDRETGQLGGCFSPRFARREPKA